MRLIPQNWCMTSVLCRRYARGDDVIISEKDVKHIIRWSEYYNFALKISDWYHFLSVSHLPFDIS